MISKVVYRGDLRTEAVHTESEQLIVTDAPKDNQGKGNAFSPTDLVATALASCILTIMGIVARRSELDLDGTYIEVKKKMSSNPRDISQIGLNIYFVTKMNEEDKIRFERAAKTCPVSLSLNPKINKIIKFIYL
tara:strand:+ start:275 stop:676 length:402 start_codon:yes stop_codon:yes gene_type:complete